MHPPQHHSWIDLTELKSQIIRKLGPERSKQYFDYLNKFLNLKLTKVEFDKICIKTVGKDGIRLHNQLIRSILRNACTRKVLEGNKKPSDGLHLQNGSNYSHDFCKQAKSSDKKDGKGVCNKISLHAPLGIPYSPVSIGGARRAPPISRKRVGVSDTNTLSDTITLRARMEPIAATHGIQCVSVNCANALNFGLDAYLKGLIRSCYELNCVIPKRMISLRDFRVSMELNPQKLGDDWPILLEKISTHDFEEL